MIKFSLGKKNNKNKELIIHKRIKSLYDKMYLIDDTKTDIHCVKKVFKKYSGGHVWYQYMLNTEYGETFLLVNDNKNIIFYGTAIVHRKGEYIEDDCIEDCIENNYTKIFAIYVATQTNTVRIEPKPMIKPTPEEIDSAILEFEEAIEKSYQLALARKNNHDECVKYFSKVE